MSSITTGLRVAMTCSLGRGRTAPKSVQTEDIDSGPTIARSSVLSGQLVEQTDGAARRIERRHQPLQRAGEHVLELERTADPVGDLVDGLQLPHEPTVLKVHAPTLECTLDRRKQPIDVERLLDEGKCRHVAGGERSGQGCGPRHDDDLRIRRQLLDPRQQLEAGLAAERDVHNSHIGQTALDRFDRLSERAGHHGAITARARSRRQQIRQIAVVLDDENVA